MASKFLTGLAAAALIAAPTTVLAQSAPSPAAETVSSQDGNELRAGGGLGLGAVFFSALILLIVFQDDLFGNDDELNGPVTP